MVTLPCHFPSASFVTLNHAPLALVFLLIFSLQSMVVVLEAHAALVALLRSDLRCPGVDPNGEWPLSAKRLARVACAFADRVEVAVGASHRSTLADDDILLLCQGGEVLEALADCSSVFFQGHEQRKSSILSKGAQTRGRGDRLHS